MSRLEGIVAIVTGGGQGFGAGIVKCYVEQGAKVVNMDLTAQDGPMKGYPEGSAWQIKANVTKAEDWRKAIKVAAEKFGSSPTVVVNNAGWTYSQKPTLDLTEEEFDKVFEINVKSIFISFRELIPIMQRAGGGSFINISSTAAIRPRPRLTWYNATKGAVSTASKAMAIEHAKDKIRFNCVNPVAGNTPLLSKFAGAQESGDALTDAQLKMFNESVPLGRLCEPSDVGNACLFLADPASHFITGLDLPVDGGRCV
ncbi:NAD(P)-binding protein [Violaceomyces palustris]|uniref:NAD(P)-binding protein n=1 Tax=Violaceomyces palustris TaxID=1673888 RepID=A0ACD0P2M2_9BASI|nr:NAD(P)-binding protein [Violaceomyces palustris]